MLSDLSDDHGLNAIEIFPNMLVFLKSSKRESHLIAFPLKEIFKEMLALNGLKATQSDGILTKFIKNNCDIFF